MDKTTNRQIFFLIFITLTTYTTIDLPQIMAQTTGRSSWIPIIISSILFAIAIFMIASLNNMFQGKVFFDYAKTIVGKHLIYIIGIYYVAYFILVGIYLKLKMVLVLNINFLPETPEYVLLIMGITLFAYVSYKGITNVARLFEIYGILFLLITIGICILMFTAGEKYNILPFISPSEIKRIPEALKVLILPYGGIEVLLILPFTAMNKKAPRVAFLTLLFIGVFYVLIVEATIFVLGINNTIVFNDPFIEALKITEAPVLERIDIFYLTFGLSSLFCGMIIVFLAALEFACKVFSWIERRTLTIAIAIVFFLLTMLASEWKYVRIFYETHTIYLIILSAIIIPGIVFALAKIRKQA